MVEWDGPRYREGADGAYLVVCGEACETQLTRMSGLTDFECAVGEFGDCQHCACCGLLVEDPPRWCPIHGLSCPESHFTATYHALVFAVAWSRFTTEPITDLVWDMAEDDFTTRAWINPIESARRIGSVFGLLKRDDQ